MFKSLGVKIMRTLISILLVLIISYSCSNDKKLETDKIIKKVYNESDIVFLKKILVFFDSEICKLSDKTDLYDCYQDYFDFKMKQINIGEFTIRIPFDKQLELFNSFDSTFIFENWGYGRMHERKEDKYYEYLNLRNDGKFSKFLELLSSENKKFRYYSETLNSAGCITPSMIGGLIINAKEYDIKDEKVRLVFAIHYLTLNDENKSRREVNGFK